MEILKEKIANIIVKSLEHDFLDKKYSLDLDSKNCFGMMKSDIINTNLRKVFDSERYIIHKFNRFAWEGRFIIDLDTKSLVSITSISNLNHVPKVKERKIPHYMQTLLNCLNEEIKSNQQISFEGFSSFDSEVYKDDLNNILSGLDLNFEEYTYYVVAYNFYANKVLDINWYLLGPRFNIAEKTSLMGLVKPDFINLTMEENIISGESQSNSRESLPKKGIKLGLKEEPMKKEGE